MTNETRQHNHSALGPALGYLYQAYYALIALWQAGDDEAFVSLESWDDVYIEDRNKKSLHQLKHTIDPKKKIGIKSREIWKTLKVWCDYCQNNDFSKGEFVLATVADVDYSSSLKLLSNETDSRETLLEELIIEAERVKTKRKEQKKENELLVQQGKKEKSLSYEDRYKGCYAFLDLNEKKRKKLLSTIKHRKGLWSIDQCQDEIIKIISPLTTENIREPLAKRILEWWNREAVDSLLDKRARGIYLSELKNFICQTTAQLFNDELPDDISDMDTPSELIHKGNMKKQLEIIDATSSQIRRAVRTEWRARTQQHRWLEDNPAILQRLRKYDKMLIEEWDDRHSDIQEELRGEESNENMKKNKGRKLLDWSHYEAPKQIRPISKSWNNDDFIRGSYQILTKDLQVGWHPDFKILLGDESGNE
ncbi:MAG: hypothetical protein D3904_01025 [Candidatus Electrothrix sp. EH2]|nr:hypothetical protein [Candidatus Electrothrix sp. EH2]